MSEHKLPTDDDEIVPATMPDEEIGEDDYGTTQDERKLAQVKRDRLERLNELEDEKKAYNIKHPDAEWDPIKLNELNHLLELHSEDQL